MADQSYVAFDAVGRQIAWPTELHGIDLQVFHQHLEGFAEFARALAALGRIEGIVVLTPPSGLSALIAEFRQHFSRNFAEVMSKTLVLASEEEDTGHSPLESLERLHGFKSLALSPWSEKHLAEFIGNIFQPPAARLLSGAGPGGLAPATQMADFYQLLGLRPEAGQEELEATLRSYREYWSERTGEEASRGLAQYSLILIGQAESTLLDKVRRERYDAMLGTARAVPRSPVTPPSGDVTPVRDPAGPEPAPSDSARVDLLGADAAGRDRESPSAADLEDAMVREAMADPELTWLPGLGQRREDPDGEPWPPVDWPPPHWAERSSDAPDMSLPFDDDMDAPAGEPPGDPLDAPEAPEAPLPSADPLSPNPAPVAAPPPRAPIVRRRPRDDVPVDVLESLPESWNPPSVTAVPRGHPGVEVWVASELAAEHFEAFEIGFLAGLRLQVATREILVVTAVLPATAAPPPGCIGAFVQTTGPGGDTVAAKAARSLLPPGSNLVLACESRPNSGRFVWLGEARGQPISITPAVSLENWQVLPAGPGRDSAGRYRWRGLAAACLLALASYTAMLYRPAFAALVGAGPVLGRLSARAAVGSAGVALSWLGTPDRVAIYRIAAADPMAHWQLIATVAGTLHESVDPDPLRWPGSYRYLLLAASQDPLRTEVSSVQSVVVP